MDITVDWSSLPVELWQLIGGKLKLLRIESLHFRSVCHSWRSSLPPFHPPLPPKFPLPDFYGLSSFLSQSTLYLLRTPSTSSPAPPSSGGWLVKVEECDRLVLRNPITSRRIMSSSSASSSSPEFECLSLLEFKMVELGKSYFLRYIQGSGSVSGLEKVIVVPPEIVDPAILVISDKGGLYFARSGDQKLTRLSNGGHLVCDDVIVRKGHPYAVDSFGCVYRIDLSSHSQVMVKISLKLVGLLGGKKHLVECCGELYMVDRLFEQEQNKKKDERNLSDWPISHRGRTRRYNSGDRMVVDFMVYKMEMLDGELGRWVEVESLGEQAIFLAMDCCFSVSAPELAGCKGDCIYFSDGNDLNLALREVSKPESFVYNLEDHSIRRLGSSPGDSQIFWPPPIGLNAV